MRLLSVRLNHVRAIVAMLCALASPAWAADGAGSTAATQADIAAERFDFDIPAQPLADALRRYASLTHQPTLFRSDLVNGRTSMALHGSYSSEVALYRLLGDTGLMARKSDAGGRPGFVLTAVDPSVVAPRTTLGSLTGYPSLIQARVWEALCADARTAPGAYRSLLRFEVDAAGQLQRPRLIGSTGDAPRDAAMLAALRRVRVDGPPPPELPQPVTMLIVPGDADSADGQHCGEAS